MLVRHIDGDTVQVYEVPDATKVRRGGEATRLRGIDGGYLHDSLVFFLADKEPGDQWWCLPAMLLPMLATQPEYAEYGVRLVSEVPATV